MGSPTRYRHLRREREGQMGTTTDPSENCDTYPTIPTWAIRAGGLPQRAGKERVEALPVALGRGFVVHGATGREGETVVRPRIPLDARVRTGRAQMCLQGVDHLLGGVLVVLGAGEVELALDLVGPLGGRAFS